MLVILVENCAIKLRCLICRGDDLSAFCLKAKVTGLWLVKIWKERPSNKYWKYLMAAYIANSSRSYVLYCFIILYCYIYIFCFTLALPQPTRTTEEDKILSLFLALDYSTKGRGLSRERTHNLTETCYCQPDLSHYINTSLDNSTRCVQALGTYLNISMSCHHHNPLSSRKRKMMHPSLLELPLMPFDH